MDKIQNIVILAMIFIGITLVFPVQGLKALVMRIINGLCFGVSAILLVVVVVIKLPILGWSSISMPVLSCLATICFVKMVVTLTKAVSDFIKHEIIEYYVSSWTLVRGSTFHTPTSVYYIKGSDQTGKKIRFYINRSTFLDLLDESGPYQICIKAYKCTKIVMDVKYRRN